MSKKKKANGLEKKLFYKVTVPHKRKCEHILPLDGGITSKHQIQTNKHAIFHFSRFLEYCLQMLKSWMLWMMTYKGSGGFSFLTPPFFCCKIDSQKSHITDLQLILHFQSFIVYSEVNERCTLPNNSLVNLHNKSTVESVCNWKTLTW